MDILIPILKQSSISNISVLVDQLKDTEYPQSTLEDAMTVINVRLAEPPTALYIQLIKALRTILKTRKYLSDSMLISILNLTKHKDGFLLSEIGDLISLYAQESRNNPSLLKHINKVFKKPSCSYEKPRADPFP